MTARGKCCGCFPGVIDIIVETTEHYHGLMQSPAPKVVGFCSTALQINGFASKWPRREPGRKPARKLQYHANGDLLERYLELKVDGNLGGS